MSPFSLRRKIISAIVIAGLGIGMISLAYRRFMRTAEYVARYGTDSERVAVCRVLPNLSAARRKRLFFRLIDDPIQSVRLGAITAVRRTRNGSDPDIDARLRAILENQNEPDVIRIRAGHALIDRQSPDHAAAAFIDTNRRDNAFRQRFSALIVFLDERRLSGADDVARHAMVACALDDADPARDGYRRMVLDHIDRFSVCRTDFLDALDRDENDEDARRFEFEALRALDGIMRGWRADDWRVQTVDSAQTRRRHVFEAEWVQDIQPNYEIIDFKGERCLALGEGAGGIMHWLKGADGTADVGEARFTLFVLEDGEYSFWVRSYFDDKCGNSFGLIMDGMRFGNFSDATDVLSDWHWMVIKQEGRSTVHLAAGRHRLRLEAWEDGVYLDKFALLPAGDTPETTVPEPRVIWDSTLPSSISFSLEHQSQPRGETQYVTVWIRRNTDALTGGTVELTVPDPFEILGGAINDVRFAAGNPLCRTSFRVRLPGDAPASTGRMTARYTDVNGTRVDGRFILGAQWDWLCTGPLKPDDPTHRELSSKTEVTDAELSRAPWGPFPRAGYDAYRRLDFEKAYGELENVFLYLAADIDVLEKGRYLFLLTSDDWSEVYLDGKSVIVQPKGGPAEGRMVMKRVTLSEGRHRVFVRMFQAGFSDPAGAERLRHSQNHCVFKLLIRSGRHRAARGVKGVSFPTSIISPPDRF